MGLSANRALSTVPKSARSHGVLLFVLTRDLGSNFWTDLTCIEANAARSYILSHFVLSLVPPMNHGYEVCRFRVTSFAVLATTSYAVYRRHETRWYVPQTAPTDNLFGNPSSVNSDPTITVCLQLLSMVRITSSAAQPHHPLPICLRLAYPNTNASLTNSFQRGRNPVRSQ